MSKPKYNYAEFLEAMDYIVDVQTQVASGALKLTEPLARKLEETLRGVEEYKATTLSEIRQMDAEDYQQDCDDMH